MSRETRNLDVVIIGAGPAGLAAAIWCRELGLDGIVLEKEKEAGGQLLSIYNPIANYPGIFAANGREMRDRFLETADRYGIETIFSANVSRINFAGKEVFTADGLRFAAKAIVLATGVSRRRLNIPGEAEFIGRGILESGSRDKQLVNGKVVAIVGGGDAALENALILSEFAAKIYLIHRRDNFNSRAEFVNKVLKNPKIECLYSTAVTQIVGKAAVESIEVTDLLGRRKHAIPTDFVLLRIGVVPNSSLLLGTDSLNEAGFPLRIQTDEPQFVFPAGDVANPVGMTISTAAGNGASAGKAIHDLLKGKKRL